jgi:predicted glycosyltransferase
MKIVLYCQNLVGVGHYLRSLEICQALKGHEVFFVTGGPPIDIPPPNHVKKVSLPGLTMDFGFKNLISAEKDLSVDQVKKMRLGHLFDLFETESPAVFIVELFPFGRSAFNFELEPIFNKIHNGDFSTCHVVCSLRDILVEKRDPVAFEERVTGTLNTYFDALLVHSDPSLIKLQETFSRVDDIDIPIVYTGFITTKPPSNARSRLRKELGLHANDKLVVASSGGGKVGFRLLETVAHAFRLMKREVPTHLLLYTGPFVKDEDFGQLKSLSIDRMQVFRFTPDFVSTLAAADLSVSMAGYNTCMNTLAAGVRALVWPYARNREQGLRAELLSRMKALNVIKENDLQPVRLANLMDEALAGRSKPELRIDLDGAEKTASWLQSRMETPGRS